MRSHEVFSAAGRIENRYLLCNLVRIATRKLHKPGTPLQHTISNVLSMLNELTYLREGPELRGQLALSSARKELAMASSAA